MQSVTSSKTYDHPINHAAGINYNRTIVKNVDYVWADQVVEIIENRVYDYGTTNIRDVELPIYQYPDSNNIYIFCPGGIGDSLVLTCVIRQLQETGSKIFLVTTPMSRDIFNNELLDPITFLDYPTKTKIVESLDSYISYEHLFANINDRLIPFVDSFGLLAGISDLKYKVPQYKLNEIDILFGKSLVPKRTIRKRIAIHLQASNNIRSYPLAGSILLANKLATDYEVFLVGGLMDFNGYMKKVEGVSIPIDPPTNVYNYCGVLETVGQLGYLLTTCDLVICPNSGVMHLAGALNVPQLTLLGSSPPEFWTNYYNSTTIQLNECDPCHAAHQVECKYKENYCRNLTAINPIVLLDTVRSLVN